jgi:hypothetical protein
MPEEARARSLAGGAQPQPPQSISGHREELLAHPRWRNVILRSLLLLSILLLSLLVLSHLLLSLFLLLPLLLLSSLLFFLLLLG